MIFFSVFLSLHSTNPERNDLIESFIESLNESSETFKNIHTIYSRTNLFSGRDVITYSK